MTSVNIRFMIITIASWFFQRTPLWFLTVFMLVPAVYLTYYGLKGICRYNIVIYTVVILVVILLTANLGKVRFTFLAPLGSAGIKKIVGGIPDTGYAYMGYETLLFIYPFIKDKQAVIKYTATASAFSSLIFAAVTIVCVGVFGENLVAHRIMPIVGLARIVRFPIFERIDLYFLAAWIPGMMVCVNSYMFCLFNSCEKVFGVRSGTKPSKPMLLILAAIVIILSSLTEDINTVYQFSQYAGYLALSLSIIVPVIWLVLAMALKKGGMNV
jgi:spore germination protein (amino acid permease)